MLRVMILAHFVKQPSKLDCLKHATTLQLEELQFSPFHLVALFLFACAVVHVLSVQKIHTWARHMEMKQAPKRLLKQKGRSLGVQLLYFLAEVEVIFAFWAIPLTFAIAAFYDCRTALDYLNTRDYTEPLFVFVMLSLAATRPILHLAKVVLHWLAKGMGGSLSAWWFTLLTLGPLLGSFITEAAAMALSALLLSSQFYEYRPSSKLAYATLALLFVNISVGGVLTNFASPAVLILAHAWKWTTWDIFSLFGWRVLIGVLLANFLYWILFRKELATLNHRKREIDHHSHVQAHPEPPIPFWVTGVHLFFIGWVVLLSHYPAIFVASFLFFVGFHQATRIYQYPIRLARPMLVGLFLAGLVIHGGVQGWWVVRLLYDQSPLSVMGIAILLTGFNDNTAISYLATLVPDWAEAAQYAIYTGVIAGGGLTVIGNAPNPAGYTILNRHFAGGIRPLKLFLAALLPTIVLYAVFFLSGPFF